MAHEQFETCITACNDCADACDHCATACLQDPNAKDMARCIQFDLDCAALCRMAASYMARGSEFATDLCQLCAEICDACAEECARFDMTHCKQCAEACRRCAKACRQMAGQGQKRSARVDTQTGAH